MPKIIKITLKGGGPGDGEVIEFLSPLEWQPKLRERDFGGGFFWLYCHRAPSGNHVYAESHPRDQPDVTPPSELELWHEPNVRW